MKTHRTDGLSLTFGLIFLVITAWWVVEQAVDPSLPKLGWFVAGALILLGALGLIGAIRGNRAPAKEPAQDPTQDAAPAPAPAPAQEPVPAADERPTEEFDGSLLRDISDGGDGEPDGPGRTRPAG
jgi:hypothetical protein